jgi:hypothetical protein
MATFGRLRLDVENCLRELVEFGIIRLAPGSPSQYSAVRPEGDAINRLLDTFLERRADISTEDQAPSVQRFREMIGRDEKMLVVFSGFAPPPSPTSRSSSWPTGSGKSSRMIHG